MGLNQINQLRPRGKKVNLLQKLTLACVLGDQFKPGFGKGGFSI
jgi:hypothetical protein